MIHFSPLPPCPNETGIDVGEEHIPGITCERIEGADSDTLPAAFIRRQLPITGTSSSYIPEYEE